ncbi:MAG: lectin like domain-containing protein [Candidatus Delongbacteria bacterium]|jgi:C1A family cysteine protease|nr:lectin like domain-containing protein [Candidatus Delongbacteria bacterium]
MNVFKFKYVSILLVIFINSFSQVSIYSISFETDPFTEGWSLQTTGAGWIYIEDNILYPSNSGDNLIGHLDDQGSQDDWLISPIITLPSDSLIILTFYERSRFVEYIGSHEVCISNDGGTTWNQISSTIPKEEFNKVPCLIQGFSGQDIQIGWHYAGDYSDQWFVDDVDVYVDNNIPEITKLIGNTSIFPIIGSFSGNIMPLILGLYDYSGISSAEGHYSFDGGTNVININFIKSKDTEDWQAAIPAEVNAVSGYIYFTVTDLLGNTLSSENYHIDFIDDNYPPVIEEIKGNTAQVNNNANLNVLLADHSSVVSCTGYFSKDNFVTQYEFDLTQSKYDPYTYFGTIPAEYEVTNGKVKFEAQDEHGNVLNSSIYGMSWINELPDSFDLRTSLGYNCVSSVKQQYGGSCWAFATVAALETNLLISGNWTLSGESGEPDLSESHLDRWNGFNDFFNADCNLTTGDEIAYNKGCDYLVATAYMSRGEGFIREIDTPEYYSISDRFSENYHHYYVKNMEYYNMDHSLHGIELIKCKLMEYGGMVSSYYNNPSFFQSYISYQPPTDSNSLNHDVIIVGWDDNLNTQAPEGTGAWLCKNSFGESWADNGFFWISYYDKLFTHNEQYAASFQNVVPLTYDNIYYYDYHGWRDDFHGWRDNNILTNISEAFNSYVAKKEENLVAVSFFTAKDNVDYVVKVYDDFNGFELQNNLTTTSGHIDYKGFHTIDLPSAVNIPYSDDFYICVNLSDGGHPIDQSQSMTWYEVYYGLPAYYQSAASPGESYYKENGEWLDLYYNTYIHSPRTANFCIKGLCEDDVDEDPVIVKDYILEQNYPNPFNPYTTINFSIPEDNTKIKLIVYNIKGQLVNTIFNGMKNKGRHSIFFDASALNSGIYYYSLKVDGRIQDTKKMVMIK